VVRARDVGDVMATVDFARENGLTLSVRGGGHSVPGFGTNDDGVVVDLSLMRSIRVDPKARTARAEGGATWGDFNHATHAFGLATTGGFVSTTGIGGLTLGGGVGYLTRAFGLSADNLLSCDVVTADGRFLTASESEHADLFWALRGSPRAPLTRGQLRQLRERRRPGPGARELRGELRATRPGEARARPRQPPSHEPERGAVTSRSQRPPAAVDGDRHRRGGPGGVSLRPGR
jgi:hypothetical protein